MAQGKSEKKSARRGLVLRALDLIERWGNKLPHPITLFLLLLTLPSNGLLRDAKGGLEPFFHGMVLLMAIGFLLPGIAYGLAAGTIRSDRDAGRMIEETMGTMGSYIALAFAASQFVAYFGWSNLGLIMAVSGAEFLKATGLSGTPLILLFIFVCALIDLFLASASSPLPSAGPCCWRFGCCSAFPSDPARRWRTRR